MRPPLRRALCALVIARSCLSSQQHTEHAPDNWAVIVSTSRFWHNYRHAANALGIYRLARRLGIPDSQIVLMLAEDVGCNGRNSIPGEVYMDSGHRLANLLGGDPAADVADTDGASRQLAAWTHGGQLRHREHTVSGLEETVPAFLGLFSGANRGKTIVRMVY